MKRPNKFVRKVKREIHIIKERFEGFNSLKARVCNH